MAGLSAHKYRAKVAELLLSWRVWFWDIRIKIEVFDVTNWVVRLRCLSKPPQQF